MFQVRVRVVNSADPARYFDEDFWVDTDALYSFMAEDRLKQIGIEPEPAKWCWPTVGASIACLGRHG